MENIIHLQLIKNRGGFNLRLLKGVNYEDNNASIRDKEICIKHSEILRMWEIGTDAFKRALKTIIEIAGET